MALDSIKVGRHIKKRFRAQGGRYSAGFASGFAGSILSPLASYASTTEGKVTIQAVIGGTASAVGGGKFANGAVSAAFVAMYNEMAHDPRLYGRGVPQAMGGDGRGLDYIDLHKEELLRGAQDGHLTLDEAIAWYRYGGGKPLTVDGSLLNVNCIGSHCYVTGIDYWVHGQVSINPTNGHIYYQDFDFEMHGKFFFDDGWLGLRNAATLIGSMVAGQGQKFTIKYKY